MWGVGKPEISVPVTKWRCFVFEGMFVFLGTFFYDVAKPGAVIGLVATLPFQVVPW